MSLVDFITPATAKGLLSDTAASLCGMMRNARSAVASRAVPKTGPAPAPPAHYHTYFANDYFPKAEPPDRLILVIKDNFEANVTSEDDTSKGHIISRTTRLTMQAIDPTVEHRKAEIGKFILAAKARGYFNLKGTDNGPDIVPGRHVYHMTNLILTRSPLPPKLAFLKPYL